MVRANPRTVGNEAELLACQFLRRAGLQAVDRNYRCRFGEIDLVMLDGDCVVFVEVRFRSSRSFADAALTVDATKQRKLLTTADLFLASRPGFSACAARFDVIGIDQADDGQMSIEWLKDAFGP